MVRTVLTSITCGGLEACSCKCHLWATIDGDCARLWSRHSEDPHGKKVPKLYRRWGSFGCFMQTHRDRDCKCSFSARHGKHFFQIILVAWKLAGIIMMQPKEGSSHTCRACLMSLVWPDWRVHTQKRLEIDCPCHTKEDLLRKHIEFLSFCQCRWLDCGLGWPLAYAHLHCVPEKGYWQYFGHNFDKFKHTVVILCKEYHKCDVKLLLQQKSASPN